MIQNKADFDKRFELLDVGDEMAYHEGSLMHDRLFDSALNKVARVAWIKMERGEADLFQRKMDGLHEYQYLIRRKLPAGKVRWFGCYGGLGRASESSLMVEA